MLNGWHPLRGLQPTPQSEHLRLSNPPQPKTQKKRTPPPPPSPEGYGLRRLGLRKSPAQPERIPLPQTTPISYSPSEWTRPAELSFLPAVCLAYIWERDGSSARTRTPTAPVCTNPPAPQTAEFGSATVGRHAWRAARKGLPVCRAMPHRHGICLQAPGPCARWAAWCVEHHKPHAVPAPPSLPTSLTLALRTCIRGGDRRGFAIMGLPVASRAMAL